jgi:3',5'-cyclic AMP phosphodiesterase CpdA
MRIVVLGDLHFYQLAIWPWQLFSKRLLGQANLWLNRRRHFKPSLWPSVRDQVLARAPDALLCSGDFTTTALPGEFRTARTAWAGLVEKLKPSAGAFVVPGNHDRYTFASARKHLFEAAFGQWSSREWPTQRMLGDRTHLIGLDPTRPNPFNASGHLGDEQLSKLRTCLQEVPVGHRILILCHYPIGTPEELPDEAAGHGLQDTTALIKALAASGRPITYIHGHIHWPWKWTPPSAPNVIAINAGAPMLISNRYPKGQGFLEIEIPDEGGEAEYSRQEPDGEGGWQNASP